MKALRKLRVAPRERGELLVGVEHPVHGRIHKLRVGKQRVPFCIDESEARVYVLTFGPRDLGGDLGLREALRKHPRSPGWR